MVVFHALPYGDRPEDSGGYSEWQPVDRVREHYYGQDLPGDHAVFVRTRIDLK